jgi:hypothetical protein
MSFQVRRCANIQRPAPKFNAKQICRNFTRWGWQKRLFGRVQIVKSIKFFVVTTRLILSTHNHGSQVLVTANWRNISQVIVYPLGLIRNNQTLRI